jgi:hypothetical protein
MSLLEARQRSPSGIYISPEVFCCAGERFAMHVFSLSAPALAIGLIYAIWQRYFKYRSRRERVLRERVTYLLWVVAKRVCC